MLRNTLISSMLLISLTGCGGSSSSDSEPVETPDIVSAVTYSGIFLDSAVEGLAYSTPSQSGRTDENGTFMFQTDENITFSIGDIQLPAIKSELLLTPLNVFATDDVNHLPVVNLLRLLQSLDLDGDATNNIQIPDDAHVLAAGLSIDFNATDFEQQVSNLIASSEGVYQELISADEAIYHFQQTLSTLGNSDNSTCGKTHEKIGYSGYFETFHHNVAGKATIIDDCTIEISQFSYDGGGPDVYFFGAINHNYKSAGAFPVGNRLNGQVFENEDFTIKLPINKTLDDLTGLSVWCIDFSADFGHMEFTP